MEVKLVTVGKTDVPWVKEGLDLYVSRLRHYVPFSLVEIPQLKNVSAFSEEQIREKEGELILRQIAPGDAVFLLDEPDVIRRKIKRAVTDSETEIRFDPENKPGVSNLLTIISALTGESIDAVSAELNGQGYGALKARAADCAIAALEPLQAEFKRLMGDKDYLMKVQAECAEKAAYLATRTLRKVQKKVGFAARP